MKANMSEKNVECFRDIFTTRVATNRYLAHIATNPKEIDIIRNKAYSHPLGFRKYSLFHSDVLGGTLRFHVWDSNATTVYAEDAHTHRWNFSSIVLLGCLNFEEYVLSQEGQEVECFSCSENIYGEYGLVSRGTTKIHQTQMHKINSGSAYSFSNSQIQRVAPSACLTKTLVLQLDTQNRSSRIYRSEEIKANKVERTISFNTAARDLHVSG